MESVDYIPQVVSVVCSRKAKRRQCILVTKAVKPNQVIGEDIVLVSMTMTGKISPR